MATEGTRRTASVTLEEMIRRRDSWKGRCEDVQLALHAAQVRARLAERDLERERARADEGAENLKIMRTYLRAAQDEARQYAAQCGVLRDQAAAQVEVTRNILDDHERTIDALRAQVADYENRITWHTTCQQCAQTLDRAIADYERAERAEGELATARAESRAANELAARRLAEIFALRAAMQGKAALDAEIARLTALLSGAEESTSQTAEQEASE